MAAGRSTALIIDATPDTTLRLTPLLARGGWQVESVSGAEMPASTPLAGRTGLVVLAADARSTVTPGEVRAWLGSAGGEVLIVTLQGDIRDADVQCHGHDALVRLLEGRGASAAARATLAHDLRNALAPMRAALAILERADSRTSAGAAALSMLNKQLGQLNEHINSLSSTGSSPPRPVAVEPRPPQGRRILIADDSAAVQDAMGALLRSRGHTVRCAVDGQQALQLAQEWQPEVVLADMRMPLLDGMGLARQLRSHFPRGTMKLILMSGLTLDPVLIRHALAAGFDACIDKVAPPEQWFSEIGSG